MSILLFMIGAYCVGGLHGSMDKIQPRWWHQPVFGFVVAAMALCCMVINAHAQTVVDGDTIKLNGKTYRLYGIDAPELSQTCGDWMAGEYAAAVLRGIMDRRVITCEPKDTDRYGRTVALCRADGWDLGAWMVRLGMAWNFTRYSHAYEYQEGVAKGLNIGIHGANCMPAWDYRKEKK